MRSRSAGVAATVAATILVILAACDPGARGAAPSVTPAPAGAGAAAIAADSEPLEGFGASTLGGRGGRVLEVREPSDASVRAAFEEAAASGNAIIRFAVDRPIALTRPLPRLTAPAVTIEGNGATLDGSAFDTNGTAMLDVRTHDVIVRDLRLRNGYDNLRIQGTEASAVVVAHVSSTGARDDGISIGYGAHQVTVQYAFLAGNTRSIFCKYGGTSDVSIHHTWMQKGWGRNPLISGPMRADLRNLLVEDWTEWGARFEDGATGNLVASLFRLSPYAVTIGGKSGSALRLMDAGTVYTADNAFRGAATDGDHGGAAEPLPAPPVQTDPVATMEERVRARAGALPRDAIDRAYIALGSGWITSGTEPLRLRGE